MGLNQREYSRAHVSWPVLMLGANKTIDGTVRNISLGGALIQCGELPVLGEILDLSMEIPEYHHTVTAVAEPVRFDVLDADTGESSPSYGLGVRFTDIADEDLRVISKAALH